MSVRISVQKVPVLWRDCFSSLSQTFGQQWHGGPLFVVVWVFFLATGLFFRSFSVFIFLFLCHASAVLIRVHMLLFFDSRIDVLLGSDLWHPAAGASARAHEGALRSRSAHL